VRFGTAQPVSHLAVRRGGRTFCVKLVRPPNVELGMRFADAALSLCANHCIFCFIDQMPAGLRKTLYVKDEDVKHSFANGNYVTLGAMTYEELDRLCSLGLSPLYVSVHATDKRVRQRMLGNTNIGDIMHQLGFLEKNGVGFHAQIVVCPGFNNGAVLEQSIRDLCTFTRGLLSVAVVPVGLTRFKKKMLEPVDRNEAGRICFTVNALSDADMRRRGTRRVFLADELFILAGLPIPKRQYYEDYPQLENGIGLVRTLLDEWRGVKRELAVAGPHAQRKSPAPKILVVTSESAHPYLARIARELSTRGAGARVAAVAAKNRFFGGGVTVAGLLTARDIIRTVKRTGGQWDCVAIPAVVLNFRGHTLDGYSVRRIGKAVGARVTAIRSIGELVKLL
jgi:putative radical SAM enzyme (TIGR03279 family)